MKHLILGGARSGKSRYATQLALEHKELVALVCLFELKTGIYPTLLACPIPARAAAIVFMVISKPAKPNGLAATIANHISAPLVYSVNCFFRISTRYYIWRADWRHTNGTTKIYRNR